MFWRQKGQFQINTQQRRDNLVTQVSTYLADKNTTSKTVTPGGPSGEFWITIIVDYANQADADQVWADVQSVKNAGWLVTGFMGYARFNDDGTTTLLGRFDTA